MNRLEEILKDILTYSRTTALQLKEERIHEIVDDVLKIYEEKCRAGSITIQKSYGFTSRILLDKNRVREVVVNLLSNALDAMPGGGTIAISTAEEEFKGQPYITVKIKDTGEGIPTDRLPKIFEPFFTTKISKRGIGLGLSISKKIMEDHGGFITVESKVGMGSGFSLYFPLRPKTRSA